MAEHLSRASVMEKVGVERVHLEVDGPVAAFRESSPAGAPAEEAAA